MDVDVGFAGVSIGVAEDDEGTTGRTVLVFDDPVAMATDVRGGSSAVIGPEYRGTKAVCRAGGSILGLEATLGVQAELWEQGGRPTSFGENLPVAGAIIFDWRRRTTYAVTSGPTGQPVDVDLLGMRTSDLLWDAVFLAVTADAT